MLKPKTFIKQLRAINSTFDAAVILYENEKIAESTVFLHKTLKKIQDFFDENISKSDQETASFLNNFINQQKTKNHWCLDKIDVVKSWASEPENTEFNREQKEDIDKIFVSTNIIVKDMKKKIKYFLKTDEEKKKTKVQKIVSLSMALLIIGTMFATKLMDVREAYIYSHEHLTSKNNVFLGDEDFKKAEVYFKENESSDKVIANFRENEWHFPGLPPWGKLTSKEANLDGIMRKSIWCHPFDSGKKFIKFNDQLLGKELALFYGLSDGASQYPEGVDVHISVEIAGGKIVKNIKHRNKKGWHRTVINTAKFNQKRSDITIAVFVKGGEAKKRSFCISPYIRRS